MNWNTRDLLVKCLNSITKHQPDFEYEVIIVDNASKDGTVETVASLFGHNKRIRVIPSLKNLGFARGNNLAYEQSAGDCILMLNPDTEIIEGAVQKLVDFLVAHPSVGIVGPRLINPDGSLQESVRRFPDIWSSLLVFSGLHRIFRPRRYLMDGFNYEEPADVDQVMGAALLTRRKVISELGFLDPKFYLWYEEVDFCRRVKARGYEIKYYPKAVVMHARAQSFSQLDVYERKKIVARSLLYYFRKNGGAVDVALIEVLMPAVLVLARLAKLLQRVFKLSTHPHV